MSKSTRFRRGRTREHYWLGVELSGLERPRQWLGFFAACVGALLAALLIAFVAFA